MTEDPTSIARDANGTHQSLKGLLDTNDPYDKEVEFLRKKLRRQYLQLLFTYPHASESKDVENHLWMQTSYAFIAAYKHQVNELDRAIQSTTRQQQQPQQQPPQQQQQQALPQQRHVEYRKLLQRFRQFLAEEEKFWTRLVGRLYRTFALEEARSALELVGVPLEDEQSALGQAGVGNAGHGRNQQQFPPEDLTPRLESQTPAEKEARMSTLCKTLVCLGDVARYRELYNESGGRPKAGCEDGAPARKRNRKGPAWVESMSKARNYDKAQQCYEQAKLLVPNEGKPSHQLAILASYKRDDYMSLAYYYRSLCVKQPCDTALSNMRLQLTKVLDAWRHETRQVKNRSAPLDTEMHPGIRVEKFKQRVVVLHALWRIGLEAGVEKMNSIARKLDTAVFRDFTTLVSQRQMPPEMITHAILMSQGALWKHLMVRDGSSEQLQDGSYALLEWCIVKHVLDMHSALLEVGRDEVKVPPSHDTKDDLGQQITATFRRTLPALRVASKWLRANAKYLSHDPEFGAYQQKRRGTAVAKSLHKISGHSSHTKQFWELYSEFSRTLARTFPLSKLPKLTSPLEEDAELRGFLPLNKLMSDAPTDEQGKVKPREEVHPNEEQLMRIADLLEDAKAIAHFDCSPIQYYNKSGIVMLDTNAFETDMPKAKVDIIGAQEIVDPAPPRPPPGPSVPAVQTNAEEKGQEDSLSDISPDDGEDVVRDAFSHLDTGDQEEEDEQIVFDPRPAVSPVRVAISPPAPTSPISPPRPTVPATAALGTSIQSPSHTPPRAVAPTTAEDLLKNVMGLNRSPPKVVSAAPPPQLAFSANLTHRSAQSIWSTSQEEQRMMAGASHVGGSPLFHSPTAQYSSLVASPQMELPGLSQQSIWGAPSTFPSGRFENTQNTLQGSVTSGGLGLSPPSPFSLHHTQVGLSASGVDGSRNSLPQHKRVPSLMHQMPHQQHPQYQHHSSLSMPFSSASHGLGMTADTSLGLSIDEVANPSFAGATASSRDMFYNSGYQAGAHSYHARHLSYNENRLGPGMPSQPPPPPLWGNT